MDVSGQTDMRSGRITHMQSETATERPQRPDGGEENRQAPEKPHLHPGEQKRERQFDKCTRGKRILGRY